MQHHGVSLFGVFSFFVGVVALGALVMRRNGQKPLNGMDYTLMFIGIAGAIMGLAIVFLRFT